MIKITIDQKELNVENGTTVLNAALCAGIKIPTLCHHKELTPYGACRLCLVEVVKGGKPGIYASCLYQAVDGLEIKTDTQRVVKTRKIIFELLLARSPNSEKLKKLAVEYGIENTRFTRENPENCILCGLCERACSQISQRHAISFAHRGTERKIQTPFDRVSDSCIGCGACAYVCPTATIEIQPAAE